MSNNINVINLDGQCAGCGNPVADETRLLCKRCEDEATSISTKTFYLRMIARPESDTRFLNSLRVDVQSDDSLHVTEKDELYAAILKRQGALNSEQSPERERAGQVDANGYKRKTLLPRKGCKHLIAILFLFGVHALACFAQGRGQLVPATQCCHFADSAPSCLALVPPANSQAVESFSLLFARRLAALSMLESGDNDNAVGAAGEVSRFQIMPAIFAKYFFVKMPPPDVAAIRLRLASRNSFTAWNIARSIMQDRCKAFEAQFHRQPSDFEFYILWARPSWFLSSSAICRCAAVMDRAHRFANLCQRSAGSVRSVR